MEKAIKKQINFTEGPLFGKIVWFVLPLMATNLLQTLYNAADMMVVSLSSEPNAVGAIGTTGPFVNLIINIFIGFATGANVVVARHIGARDDAKASRTVHTSLCIGVILGFISMIFGLCFARPVLSLMGAEENLLDLAVTYTRVYFIGVPFTALTNYAVAIFRAKGDTKTPLIVLSLSGVFNVLFNMFFVLVLGLSVEGVAAATSIANALSCVVLIRLLSRDEGPCRFSFKSLAIDRESFAHILRIGLPAGIQGSLFSLSNIIIQSSVLRMNSILVAGQSDYAPVVEGNAAVANLDGFLYTATNSVYQAAITFTGQNVGANKYSRVVRVLGSCYLLTIIIALLGSGVVLGLRDPLLSLYGITHAAEGTLERIAYDTAFIKMKHETLFYFLLAFMEVGSGVVRGLGKSLTSTVITLIGACLMRIVWIYTVFEAYLNLESIYISFPISWALTGTIQLIAVVLVLKRVKARNELQRALADREQSLEMKELATKE